MANRHISVPKLIGAARAEAAVNIATLAAAGHSDPQIGRKLGFTDDQVRRVREQYKIPAGQPVVAGRTRHGGEASPKRTPTTADCTECGARDVRVWGGLLIVHNEMRVRLVPSVDGRVPQEYETDIRCEGSRQAPLEGEA